MLAAGTEDTAYSVSAADLLAGFSDVDSATNGQVLSVSSLSASNGSAVQNLDGSWTITPSANFNGAVTLTYNVTDSNGGNVGGTQSYSLAAVNDAPILDAGKTPAGNTVAEDAAAPVGAVGTLVSALVNLNPPAGGLDNVTDADAGAVTGIAITSADAANGTWFYSTNGGTNWTALGAPTTAAALLLAADADNRLYFRPNANYDGQADIVFRAWDTTTGVDGNTANTTTNGGSTAYSATTDSATFDVSAVNDAPSGTTGSITIVEDKGFTFTLASFGFSDSTDSPANTLASVTITTLPAIATGVLLLNNVAVAAGISVSAADIAAGKLTFVPANNSTTTASFTFQVADNGGTVNGGINLDPSANTLSLVITADQGDLTGNNGSTNFNITIAQGNISILDSNGNDEIIAATNAATSYSEMTFSRYESNLEFRGVSGVNTVHLTVLDHFAGTNNAVETISFTNGGTVAGFALGTGDYSLATGATGGTGADVLAGSSADDTLAGNAGNDLVFGGSAGNDSLSGGAGNDLLVGGAGNDTFIFDTALNGSTNVDTISDFVAANDQMSLDQTIFTALGSSGTLGAANFISGLNAVAADDNDYIIYDTNTGALYYDAGGNVGAVRIQFATLTNADGVTHPTITSADFNLVP